MALVITIDSPPFNGEVEDLFTVTGHVREDDVGVPAPVAMFNTDTGALMGSTVAAADGSFSITVMPAVMTQRAALITPQGLGLLRRSASMTPVKMWGKRASYLLQRPPETTLYLLSGANGMSNPPPNDATGLYTGANLQTAATFATLRSMSSAIGAGPQVALSFDSLAQTAFQQAAFLRFASPPLAAGSFINFSAGWMLNWPAEAHANCRMAFTRGRAYLWRPSTQQIVKTVYDCWSSPTATASALYLLRPELFSLGAWGSVTQTTIWDAASGLTTGNSVGAVTPRMVGGALRPSGYPGSDYGMDSVWHRLAAYRQSPVSQLACLDLTASDIQAGDVLVFETVVRGTQTDSISHIVTAKLDGTGTYNTATGPAALKFWDANIVFQ